MEKRGPDDRRVVDRISNLLQVMRARRDCRVDPPALPPVLADGLELPAEVAAIYAMCGGAELFIGAAYPFTLSSPDRFEPTNLRILGSLEPDDRSSSLYVLGHGSGRDLISVDCHPSRSGRCYDSFDETHGLIGQTPVVAPTVGDFFDRLLADGGSRYFWESRATASDGDLYDA